MQDYVEWTSASPIKVLEGCNNAIHTTRAVPRERMDTWTEVRTTKWQQNEEEEIVSSGNGPTTLLHVLQCPIPTSGSRVMHVRVRLGTVATLPPLSWEEVQATTAPRRDILRAIAQNSW